MKKLYIATLIFFIIQNIFAQTPQWQWVQSGGGDGDPNATPQSPVPDKIWSSAIDKDGNLIVGGEISWYPNFDTIHFGSNVNWQTANWFLAKYDKCGNVLWARVGGGESIDYLTGLDVDERGNIYTIVSTVAQGNLSYIHTPAKDTALANCFFFIGKFDPDGNLTYVKTYNSPINAPVHPERGRAFKRLKNGNLLTVLTVYSATNSATLGNFQLLPPYSRNFILFDSLGNVIKGALIDTIGTTGSSINKFMVDENENIYFSIVNLGLPTVSFLSHVYNPAPQYTGYFIKTDTSFVIKNANLSGYKNTAIFDMTYSNGYFYGSGRNVNGAIFDSDTTHTTNLNGVFTAYKIDTNLHKVWVSRPSYMQYDPTYTYIYPAASKDYLYLGITGDGSYVWSGDTLSTTQYYLTPAFFRLRTSDGVCVSSEKGVQGNNASSSDLVNYVFCDAQGNFQMMGEFTAWCGIPTDSVYANGSNASPDYFILKWGLNCSDSLNSLDKPDAPTNLVATASGTHSIDVTWSNNSVYHAGFHLYRSTPDSISNWVQIASTDGNVYSYTDTNVIPNTIYWYKVAAYTAGGESGFSNKDSAEILQQNTQCNSPITISATALSTSCGLSNGSVTTLVTSGTGPFIYLWNNGVSTANISSAASGTYSVTISSGNCTATASATVAGSVAPLPVTITANATTVCVGDSAQICAQGSYVSYLWNTAQSTACIYSNQAGDYYVTVTDANSCTAASNHLIIAVYPAPSASVTVSGDSLISSAGTSYQWYLNDSVISNTSRVIIATQSGNYTTLVTDSNGCVATVNTTVTVSGIKKVAGDNVSVYPNPSESIWYLQVSDNYIGSRAEITDAAGKVVYTFTITRLKSELKFEAAKGVYFLNIKNSSGAWSGKLVKD